MSFAQFIATLKARKWTFAIVALSIITLAVIISLVLPKKYTATATVLIDVKSPDPIAGMILPGMMTPSYMATQLEVLRSERVAQRVIETLKLAEQPQLRQDWQETTNSQGDYRAWVADLLGRNLDVIPSREANIINVTYTAVDPGFAATMANSFVKAYIETTVDLRVDPAKQYSAMFDTQSKALRQHLEAAQSRLSVFQKENGLIATDERLDIETTRLNELSNQLVLMQAISAESSSRKRRSGSNAPEVLNNGLVAGLKADLSRQEARQKELNARLGSAHPQVIELQANISELRARIDSEIGRVTTSMGINDSVNLSREAQVKEALEQQRQKLLKLRAQRDQAAVLMRDVEYAQRAHDAVQARVSQTNLESQSNQTNVSLLKNATPPPSASSPRLFLNIAIAIFLGINFGMGACVLQESFDKRLRTNEDVLDRLGMPIMATLPSPSKPMLIAGDSRKTNSLGIRSLPELPTPGR